MESGIPIHIIHGNADPLATLFFARRVQRRLRCKFTLTGAATSIHLPPEKPSKPPVLPRWAWAASCGLLQSKQNHVPSEQSCFISSGLWSPKSASVCDDGSHAVHRALSVSCLSCCLSATYTLCNRAARAAAR